VQYVAEDFLAFVRGITSGFAAKPDEPAASFPSSKPLLVMWSAGALVLDLISAGVLAINSDGSLIKSWQGSKDTTPAILKLIQQTQTPEDAFVL
jgi:hypothetical protein